MATYLENVDFSSQENPSSCGAHLAYTFDFQGGAASGYNEPLMFKADSKVIITKAMIEAVKAVGEDVTEIQKAYYSQIRAAIQKALDEKEFGGKWAWNYVSDFDETNVIFCTDDGLFSAGYTLEGLVASINDVAVPVVQLADYQVVDGDVLVSVDFLDNVSQATVGMVKSSLKIAKVKESLIKAKNSVNAEGKPKPEGTTSVDTNKNKGVVKVENINLQDVLKSAEAQEMLKALIAEATAEATKGKDAEIEKLKAAENSRVEKAHREVIKSFTFVPEDKVDALVKTFIDNPEVSILVTDILEKASTEIEEIKTKFATEVGSDTLNKDKALDANALVLERASKLKTKK